MDGSSSPLLLEGMTHYQLLKILVQYCSNDRHDAMASLNVVQHAYGPFVAMWLSFFILTYTCHSFECEVRR